MMYIVNIGECYRAFRHAHSALLDKRGNPLWGDQWRTMIEWWQEEYEIEVIAGNSRFEQLGFKSEHDYTLFLLRWS